MLEGLKPSYKRTACSVQLLLNRLDEADAKILADALADVKTWSSNHLSKALRERTLIVADYTITKHRNKVCICYKG